MKERNTPKKKVALFGENNELKNRYLHIKFTEQDLQMQNDSAGRKGLDVEKTVEKILEAVKKNPKVTQKELSELTGLSRRGIEWNLAQLKQKGIIKRIGADKGGFWQIILPHK